MGVKKVVFKCKWKIEKPCGKECPEKCPLKGVGDIAAICVGIDKGDVITITVKGAKK